jgi:cyclic pyranopterin phosphate synthase
MATRKAPPQLSHVDAAGRPGMVDVSAKATTARDAEAECLVVLPPGAADALREGGMRTRKGPVFDTAIVAGTLAAKRTHELIPFCHPLAIDACRIVIEFAGEHTVRVLCRVGTQGRTGVEMEALTGATVAALTIYDMCKALGQGIVIGPARLLAKRGGRSGDWQAGP